MSLSLKVPTAGVVTCGLVEYDTAGNRVEVVEYAAFPASGSYQTRQATISIGTNNNLFVMCAYNHGNAAVEGVRLLSISY